MESANVASWVQAFGSIAAIIGAYLVGERQAQATLRNELKLKQHDLEKKYGSILAIAAAAVNHAVNMESLYRDGPATALFVFITYDEQATNDVLNALAAVPVHEIGSFNAVTAFLRMKKSFIYLNQHLSKDYELLRKLDKTDEQTANQQRNHYTEVIRTNSRLIQQCYSTLDEVFREQSAMHA
jgi:hypothetical protein